MKIHCSVFEFGKGGKVTESDGRTASPERRTPVAKMLRRPGSVNQSGS